MNANTIFATVAFLLGTINPANAQTLGNGQQQPSKDVVINVPVLKDIKPGKMRMPSIPIYLSCWIGESSYTIEVPEEMLPCNVELEQLTAPYGYWTSSSDSSSCTFDFDGTVGDYKLTLTSDEADYIGCFSLE